ncbi:Sphingosine kinase 1 [Turnera subulata]|uniref:sphingosine kinase n=1 Tax=Turnera subulata TaxID=218843 RepID=A0A9Q0FNX8_9ROSI|nr:Sphingosine kinase 1 [Turnera subulata]
MDQLRPESSSSSSQQHHPNLVSDRVRINGAVTVLTLTADGKLRWTGGEGQRDLTLEKEVLGFAIEGAKIRVKTVVEKGGGICCVGSAGTLVRKDFVFEPLNRDAQVLWCRCLRDSLDSLGRPKRLFVFVNPFGGKNCASKIFFDDVKPLLEDAGVQFTLQETKYRLHAKDVASHLDLSKYDGIVCVSGDGVLAEVVNGLLSRDDWSEAIKMPIGMVPAGTGNGMVKSALDLVGEPCKATNAVLAIIRGHKRTLDVATMVQGGVKYFSVLMLAWGLVADIDIESEKYRWMGSARLEFYAFQRIFNMRKYNGCISFVPAPGFEAYGEPSSYSGESPAELNSSLEQPGKTRRCGYQGPDVDLTTLNWRTINGPFVSVWLHNVPWGAEDTMAAPDAKFSDGYLDLILIKDCPKLFLLSFLTQLSTGDHVTSEYVVYLKVKAFILEPGSRVEETTKGGIIDVDGEVLARGNGTYKCDEKTLMAYDKLQIVVDQGLATVYAPV